MKLVKIFDIKKANRLLSSGFQYTTEIFNGKTIFVFIATDELLKNIQSNFANNEFFVDRTLNF